MRHQLIASFDQEGLELVEERPDVLGGRVDSCDEASPSQTARSPLIHPRAEPGRERLEHRTVAVILPEMNPRSDVAGKLQVEVADSLRTELHSGSDPHFSKHSN